MGSWQAVATLELPTPHSRPRAAAEVVGVLGYWLEAVVGEAVAARRRRCAVVLGLPHVPLAVLAHRVVDLRRVLASVPAAEKMGLAVAVLRYDLLVVLEPRCLFEVHRIALGRCLLVGDWVVVLLG